MYRALLLTSFTLLLAACGPPSVEDFMEDPELLAEIAEECQLEIAQGKPKSEQCRNAQKAAETMAENLMKDAFRSAEEALKGLRK